MVKKIKFNKTEIEKLPTDKPILYKITTEGKKLNYAGIAKRGRAQERLKDHLGNIPGATVTIEQFSNIKDARSKEKNMILRNKPKYNKQGK